MPTSRKKPEEPQEEGAPAWMNTYGDMVTLVLTFFVLLFSFSTVDAKKWKEIVQSFSGNRNFAVIEMVNPQVASYSALEYALGSPGPKKTPKAPYEAMSVAQQFDELYEKIKEHIQDNSLEASLQVSKSAELIVIRITDQALFDSGSDEIRHDSLPMLQSLMQMFETYQESIEQILIEGHTDNVPIKSLRFRSNWELSTARAVTMVEYCIENSSISSYKYAASGYGEHHPIATNDTEEGKAKNRRVDFVIRRAMEEETDAK
ncbi:MAG: flagellar motor protein MotB [Bacillota bacterium]